MTEVTLHPTPRWSDVALEQIRLVGLGLRRAAIASAVLLLLPTFLILSDVAGGGPGFDSDAIYPTPFFSFIFAFTVWTGEKRFGPGFLWTLPVDRRKLALTRVFAGWVWMTAGLAFFIAWLTVMALIAHASVAQNFLRIPWIGTTAAYALGSAIVLGLRHPLRWLFGAAGVIVLIGRGIQPFESREPLKSIFDATGRAVGLWGKQPDFVQWTIPSLLMLGAGLAALWAAASRHRETRRH